MKENFKNENDINPYEIDKLSKIPSWLIILFLKYWAAAAAVFFSVIGGPDIGLNLDETTSNDPLAQLTIDFILVIFIGLFIALFLNYIVRPIVRLMYNRRNNTYRYNLINVKGFKSFLLALVYGFVVSIILWFVVRTMSLHGLVFDFFGTTGGVGLEPISYGLYFIIVDGIFILIKNLIVMIAQRIKYKKQIMGD